MIRLFSSLVIFLGLLTQGLCLEAKDYKPAKYTKYATEIISAFEKDVKKEYGLGCEGYGGQMSFDVEEISVDLFSLEQMTIEEARVLEVQLTEKLAQRINAHEKIRPFLREYPFPSTRAAVGIAFFPKKKKNQEDKPSLDFLFQARKTLFYCTKNQGKPGYTTLFEEPYEDARKIVLGDSKSGNSSEDRKK